MKKQHALLKIALGIDALAVVALLIYFIAVVPNAPPVSNYGGLLILSPPLFGLFAIVPAIAGYAKCRTGLGVALIAVNVIFLFWWPIVWGGGTMLLGP